MDRLTAQLFILPFAGGTKAYFKEFVSYIEDDIEVITVEYPGRGTRVQEAFCTSMEELILDAKKQIYTNRRRELPFAMLGYSMGCEVVFDLAQYALEEDAYHLFFCARESIQYDTKGHDYALLDMKDFAERMVELGGIDEKVKSNERFLKVALRPVYADYKLLHDYTYQKGRGLLKQDITVFYNGGDTPKEKVMGWKEQTFGEADFYEFGGNHFFIRQYGKEMAGIVSEYMHRLPLREKSKSGL